MPNKTIYVADDDLPVFQRAQELVGGNLSSTVVSALRRLIELEEGREAGFEEVVLQVGRDGVRQVRFQGVDRKSTRLNSSHIQKSRMPSSA